MKTGSSIDSTTAQMGEAIMATTRTARTSHGRCWRAAAGISVLVMVAGACGDDDSAADAAPSATFDGSACVYDGPSEFSVDTEATFTVLNASDKNDVGFSVWKVPDGTTTTDITENTIFGIGADIDTDMRVARFQGSNQPGQEQDLVVALDTPGTWVLNCWNGSDPGVDYPATAFTVTDN